MRKATKNRVSCPQPITILRNTELPNEDPRWSMSNRLRYAGPQPHCLRINTIQERFLGATASRRFRTQISSVRITWFSESGQPLRNLHRGDEILGPDAHSVQTYQRLGGGARGRCTKTRVRDSETCSRAICLRVVTPGSTLFQIRWPPIPRLLTLTFSRHPCAARKRI